MLWLRIGRRVGFVLLGMGVLVAGFAVYLLWGTGIETARAQARLEREFEQLIAVDSSLSPGGETADPASVVEPVVGAVEPVEQSQLEQPAAVAVPVLGDAVARIEIAGLGVDRIVVAGDDAAALKQGPGHIAGTPLPGQLGNSALLGHRTTYGAPFEDLDLLAAGDEIRVTTAAGVFVYSVTGSQIVLPSDYWVITDSDPEVATLTLITCNPKWSTRERLVVSAVLQPTVSDPAVAPAVLAAATAVEVEGEDRPVEGVEGAESAAAGVGELGSPSLDSFQAGWFSDSAAWWHVVGWGVVLVLVGCLVWLSRRLRRPVALAVGAAGVLPGLVVIYFWYQNIARLMPPNL